MSHGEGHIPLEVIKSIIDFMADFEQHRTPPPNTEYMTLQLLEDTVWASLKSNLLNIERRYSTNNEVRKHIWIANEKYAYQFINLLRHILSTHIQEYQITKTDIHELLSDVTDHIQRCAVLYKPRLSLLYIKTYFGELDDVGPIVHTPLIELETLVSRVPITYNQELFNMLYSYWIGVNDFHHRNTKDLDIKRYSIGVNYRLLPALFIFRGSTRQVSAPLRRAIDTFVIQIEEDIIQIEEDIIQIVNNGGDSVENKDTKVSTNTQETNTNILPHVSMDRLDASQSTLPPLPARPVGSNKHTYSPRTPPLPPARPVGSKQNTRPLSTGLIVQSNPPKPQLPTSEAVEEPKLNLSRGPRMVLIPVWGEVDKQTIICSGFRLVIPNQMTFILIGPGEPQRVTYTYKKTEQALCGSNGIVTIFTSRINDVLVELAFKFHTDIREYDTIQVLSSVKCEQIDAQSILLYGDPNYHIYLLDEDGNVTDDPDLFYLTVMPKYDASLDQLQIFDRILAVHITEHVYDTVSCLHKHGQFYFDIKPANILFKVHDDKVQITVGDLGSNNMSTRFVPELDRDGMLRWLMIVLYAELRGKSWVGEYHKRFLYSKAELKTLTTVEMMEIYKTVIEADIEFLHIWFLNNRNVLRTPQKWSRTGL